MTFSQQSPLFTQLHNANPSSLAAIAQPYPPELLEMAVRGQQELGQIYKAGDYQLVLGYQPPDLFETGTLLEGQIINLLTQQPVDAGTISLLTTPETTQQTTLDTFGYFEFASLASGDYVLQIELPSKTATLILEITLP